MRCEDTHTSLFSRTLSGKLFRICKLVNVRLCMCVDVCMFPGMSVPVSVVHSLQENLHYNES